MARSMFNASLAIGEWTLPVKLYAAVEPRPVGFRLLDARDETPVRQRLVHPQTGEEVPREAAQKGLATPGGMVLLRDEELAALEPAPSRTIELLRFVPPARLDHRWVQRPYYLGPASDAAVDDYFALARALAVERREGIVRWTMRKKLYHGALREHGSYLALLSLRFAAQIVELAAQPEQAWPELADAELNMARQLIAMLEGELDPAQFHDRYAEQLAALVEAKAAGRPAPAVEPAAEPAPPPSLSDALAASIARIEEAQRVA